MAKPEDKRRGYSAKGIFSSKDPMENNPTFSMFVEVADVHGKLDGMFLRSDMSVAISKFPQLFYHRWS